MGIDHPRTREITIQIATRFKLNCQVKRATRFRVLNFSPHRYPQVSKSSNLRCVDWGGFILVNPMLVSHKNVRKDKHLISNQGGLPDSIPVKFNISCVPTFKGTADSLRIERLISLGEATHATPQDLSTLLRWS